MATKQVDIPGIGRVLLAKSRRSRAIRLTVTHRGIRVSLPAWTPYAAGINFAKHHAEWISAQTAKLQKPPIIAGQKVGKMHTLAFAPAADAKRPGSRITTSHITVQLAPGETPSSPNVQQRSHKAIIRTLKKEAELLLPPRLQTLAQKNGVSYRSVSIKQLKRRWGSCDSRQNIVFNLFLMELPWALIDYVLCHELTHLDHMNHSEAFWRRAEQLYPQARQANRQLRTYQPIVTGRPVEQTETEDDLL